MARGVRAARARRMLSARRRFPRTSSAAPAAELVEHRLGDDRARRVAGAEEEDVDGAGHWSFLAGRRDHARTMFQSCDSAPTRGPLNWALKRLPFPGVLVTCSVAPWRPRACFTIASPSPVPPLSRERPRSTR